MSLESAYGLRLLAKPRVRLGVLVVLTAIVLIYRLVQFAIWTNEPVWAYDFAFYWTAANHLLHGEPIYSAAQLAGPYVPQAQEGFLYPPALAAAVIPFALAFKTAASANWVWAVIGGGILIWSILPLVRSERLGQRFALHRGRGRWWPVAAAFAFPPVIDELVVGNVHLLLVGLLTVAWLGVRRADQGDRRGDVIAGVAIGAATVVKLFPGLLVVWFALTGRWRAALWSAVAAVAIVLVSIPVTGLRPWLDYPTVLANLGSTPEAIDALAPTMWLAPYLGFTPARVLVTALGLAIVAWAARRADTRTSFATTIVVSILVTPALYTSYLTVLVVPMVLGFAAGLPLGTLAVAYLLMWGGQQPALGEWGWIVTKALPTAGVLLLLGLWLRRISASRTASGNDVAGDRVGPEDRLGHGAEKQDEPARAGAG